MTISHSIAGALCVLGLLTGAAHGSNINGEATYISFKVPAAGNTYPMAINSSMTVTGYYLVTNSEARGFIRTADGTIDTFGVGGAVWTEPESINAAGDITGFYKSTTAAPGNQDQGFLRYVDGRIITFDPPPQAGNAPVAFPVSINDFDDIVGTVYNPNGGSYGFTRSREGVYSSQISFGDDTVATAINASGSVVGYASSSFPGYVTVIGFVAHPDGYHFTFTVSPPSSAGCTTAATSPEAINAEGAIAGWYETIFCPTYETGGFVRSSEEVVSIFQLPGTIGEEFFGINGVGDVTGAYTDTAGDQHGFVRNPYGTITIFDPPGHDAMSGTQPTSINDAGVITGFYDGDGVTGFLRVPSTGTSTGQ
jgi:hypothetical protein